MVLVTVLQPFYDLRERVDRNVGLIAFPWPMRLATWGLSILPFRLNEFVNRFLPEKVSAGRPKVL